MNNSERACMNCKYFIHDEGIHGTCQLVENSISAYCHKWQWCVSFEKKDIEDGFQI